MADTVAPVVPVVEAPAPVVTPPAAPKQSIAEKFQANLNAQQPVTPPVAAATPETPETPEVPATPAAKSFLEMAQEAGFENLKDEADAQARLLEAYRQERQEREAATQRAQELQELARLRELQAQQLQQQPPPAAAVQPQKTQDPYGALQLDEDLIEQHFDPATKTWRDGTPDNVKRIAASYEAAQKQRLRSMVDNPREYFASLVNEFLEQGITKHQATLESKTEEEAAKQRFIREADWAFVTDPVTNQRKKDHAGNFIPSAEGIRFGQYMDAAEQIGITTVSAQLKYAQDQRDLELFRRSQTQQSTTQQAAATNEQKKQELLNRANPGQSSGGTFRQPTDAPRSQNKNLSAGEKLRAQLLRDGVTF
jgi:hypothetical protein